MQATHQTVLIGFLVAAGAILLLMAAVARTTHAPTLAQSDVTPPGYALRRGWLWVLAAVAVISLGISLPAFPYPSGPTPNVRHFSVTAMQYGFQLAPVIPVNTPIIFDVTSKDVNHGFGIYAPDGHLYAQVQAMPLYVNHLPVRFTTAGHYTIRCMEYCGIAHAAMQGAFDVR